MKRPEIFKAYQNLLENDTKSKGEPEKLDLRSFIRNYATSLANVVKAFPKDNLDINALEAHIWDRIKYFFRYESFGEVDIETKEDQRFINTAIRLIEDWFYKGDWTSCLEVPSSEDVAKIFSGREKSFLQRTRKIKDTKASPNLGRDSTRPLPNIYEDAASSGDLQKVYKEHAFKFLHGPAAVINTLTKVRSRRGIIANDSKFQGLITATANYYPHKLASWGFDLEKSRTHHPDRNVNSLFESEKRMRMQPDYIRKGQEYKRNLFFLKTSLIAAELIRRTGEGGLTKEVFEKTMEWLRKQAVKEPGSADFIPFDFVAEGSRSSLLHLNTKELPFALFAVDYLKNKRDKGRP